MYEHERGLECGGGATRQLRLLSCIRMNYPKKEKRPLSIADDSPNVETKLTNSTQSATLLFVRLLRVQ